MKALNCTLATLQVFEPSRKAKCGSAPRAASYPEAGFRVWGYRQSIGEKTVGLEQ